ncbi:hypothetical protein MYX84_15085, partial [Acidobacteria bacterium AH-259-O06]|nr:hypothetical protein [Acidobacteria bacterium AH-259-O06]
MIDFLKGWGTLIVAGLALAQPWLVVLWKKIFRSGTIDIYEAAKIEIGYSTFGPTIGLQGTLRAVHQDQFIQNTELTLTKLKDSSRHPFSWGVFRTRRLSASGTQDASVELPFGFMVTTVQPRPYDILFFDLGLQVEMQEHLDKARAVWTDKWTAVREKIRQEGFDQDLVEREAQNRIHAVYEDVRKTSDYLDAYTDLDRLYYWEPGEYSLSMTVRTARPDNSFTRKWKFKLSDADSKRVRLNTVKML